MAKAEPKVECQAINAPCECKCKMGHTTQMQCYHWPCPCAKKARDWFFKHQKEVQQARAREIATIENPMCARCDSALAAPGYPFCDTCIRAAKEAGPALPEGKRMIEVD